MNKLLDHDLFTVQEVAGLLGLHVKTVRNFIRDGKLDSTRVGKQYRISRPALETFTGTTLATSGTAPVQVDVSTVVTFQNVDREKADRLTNVLVASMKGRPDSKPASVNAVYSPEQDSMKLFISGNAEVTSMLLGMVDTLIQQ